MNSQFMKADGAIQPSTAATAITVTTQRMAEAL
jgi:hypothetical protein